MGNPTCAATTLVPTAKSTYVILSEEVEKEVEHNEVVFSELGLIGRFVGRWLSLGDLHKWISVNCEPLVEDYVQMYPHARGFFVVVFQSVADRNKVLGSGHWSWEDKHVLMLKPWHPAFNPKSESFDRTPLWIRLPNLPMQYWFDSCFEAVGNSLGTFLMADEDSLNLLHTTFARLLVVVDVTMGLPFEISITSSKGSWLQSVDYEGIPCRCKRCFKTGHTVDSCTRLRVKRSASWWKEVTPKFYMVDKLLENAQADGWIEVKQKKGKKGLVGSVCIAPPLEGGGVPGEVAP
ncbi:uncharacterized protein LOC131857545 [Cryptomeria japonica]|uniref:uncharacterized protein LOC131857545 n=1 Tax=Cryptomeria japonica TaxID=3369 RepID=UPI0027D9DB3F|nr:uncharacterized protein LOC131857545 [Cryptomeria japonica]